MDPFWQNVYDNSKDRRYGGLFLATLLALIGSLTIGALICGIANAPDLQKYLPALLASFFTFILLLAWMVWRCIRFELKCRKERLKLSALSRDELAKAKLKLKKEIRPVAFRREKRPARLAPRRMPDTDLKY